MARAKEEETTDRGRSTRVLLILLLILLLLLLCGLLYILRGVLGTAERKPVLANPPGVELVFQGLVGPFGRVSRPFDVAYDGRDSIYVTDDKNRILVFDGDGQNGRVFVQGQLPEKGVSLATYAACVPMGVDVADDGSIYVADRQKMAVVVFNADGEKLREIPIMSPKCVEVTDGRVYVLSDVGTLFVTDTTGNPLGQWGTHGRGKEQLADPMGVIVAEDGTIFISDMNNYRIVALTPELEFLWAYGEAAENEEEWRARKLATPGGIALGEGGDIYLCDLLNSQIGVFDFEGRPVSKALGEHGVKDDQFYYLTGIEWMGDDLFVVADSFHDRIAGVRLTPQPLDESGE